MKLPLPLEEKPMNLLAQLPEIVSVVILLSKMASQVTFSLRKIVPVENKLTAWTLLGPKVSFH